MPRIPSRPLPEKIGPYPIRELLGSGGMGLLYLAVDPRIDRQIALKVLRASSPEFKARFLREARAAGRLSHPNIVTIFDVGDEEGQPYIAMEYVLGDTLASLIASRAPLSQQRRLQLAVQLCDGLGFAHRAGIIHRDIKPANLMVSRDSGMLKILDFGIARTGVSNLTSTGAPIGTLNYMSPEQALGRPIDHRSDIFAVGLVFYELLTSRQAFPGESQQAVINAILGATPDPVANTSPDVDPAIQDVVSRALAKAPEERYADLRAMQNDISRVLQRLEEAQGGDTVVEVKPEAPEGLSSGTKIGAYRTRIATIRAERLAEHAARASAALEATDLEAARAAIEEAAIIDVEDPRVLTLLERLDVVDRQQRARTMLADAERHFAAGELTIAIDRVDDALVLTPRAEPLLDARRRLEQAVAIRERDRLVVRMLEDARGMLLTGVIDGAMRTARQVLANVPSHPDALALLEQAERMLAERRAEEEREHRIREGIEEALAAVDEGRMDEAFSRLHALDRDHPLVREALESLRGQVQLEQDRRRLQEWSDDEVVQTRALLEQGAWSEARKRLEAGLARLSEPAAAGLAEHVNRARLRLSRELEMLELLTHARAHLAEHDHPGAAACLDAVTALDPGHRAAVALRAEVERSWEAMDRQRRREALERLIQEGLAAADQEHAQGNILGAIARLERLGSARPEIFDRLTRWRAEI